MDSTRSRVGTREIVISLPHDTPFEDIVSYLSKTLVVPRLPGHGGCDPCKSGIDRIVLESPVLEGVR
jgi:hypothetical protein